MEGVVQNCCWVEMDVASSLLVVVAVVVQIDYSVVVDQIVVAFVE